MNKIEVEGMFEESMSEVSEGGLVMSFFFFDDGARVGVVMVGAAGYLECLRRGSRLS